MTATVSGLDKAELRILKRLNAGQPMSKLGTPDRVARLVEAGYLEENRLGVAITVRGQLELARLRYRNLPKPEVVFSGPVPRVALRDRLFGMKRIFSKA